MHAQDGQEQGTEPTIGDSSHQELGVPWRNPPRPWNADPWLCRATEQPVEKILAELLKKKMSLTELRLALRR